MMRTVLTPEQIRKHLQESQERSVREFRRKEQQRIKERYWQERQERAVKEPPEEKKPVLTET